MKRIKRIELNASVLFVLLTSSIVAQTVPQFNVQDIEVRFTKYLIGCMPDSAHTIEDELVYAVTGQLFSNEEGRVPLIANGYTPTGNNSTPYEVLTDLVAAYHNGDLEQVKRLYEEDAHPKLTQLFEGENATEFINTLKYSGTYEIILCYAYQEGYMIIGNSAGIGITQNYVVQKDGRYALRQLASSDPINWNLAQYFKYRPEPLRAPTPVVELDTVEIGKEYALTFDLNQTGNWVVLSKTQLGEPVYAFFQDGGEHDQDSTPGRVTFTMKGNALMPKGKFQLNVAESNYPIRMVSPEVLERGRTMDFVVK